MWISSEQDPLCTSSNEEFGPLVNNAPLTETMKKASGDQSQDHGSLVRLHHVGLKKVRSSPYWDSFPEVVASCVLRVYWLLELGIYFMGVLVGVCFGLVRGFLVVVHLFELLANHSSKLSSPHASFRESRACFFYAARSLGFSEATAKGTSAKSVHVLFHSAFGGVKGHGRWSCPLRPRGRIGVFRRREGPASLPFSRASLSSFSGVSSFRGVTSR